MKRLVTVGVGCAGGRNQQLKCDCRLYDRVALHFDLNKM